MNNKVDLTDDELSLIQTALQTMILGINKYEENNALDSQTEQVKRETEELFARLKKEYF